MTRTQARETRAGVLPQADLDIPMPQGAAVPREGAEDTYSRVKGSKRPTVRSGGAWRLPQSPKTGDNP
jgi:hypothetical protein